MCHISMVMVGIHLFYLLSQKSDKGRQQNLMLYCYVPVEYSVLFYRKNL